MQIGDYAKLVGLQQDNLNGSYVEILTELVENEVPEDDGVLRKAKRYGVQIIGGGSGYARPENLEFVTSEPHKQRAIRIHVTGWE